MNRLLSGDSLSVRSFLVRKVVLRNYRPHGKSLVTSGERPVSDWCLSVCFVNCHLPIEPRNLKIIFISFGSFFLGISSSSTGGEK